MNKIELPYPPKELNPNKRAHFHKKAIFARKYRADCYVLAKALTPSKELFITFCPPDKRKRDRDNCIAAFKAGQDGIAQAWGVDDSEFLITYAPLGEPVKGGRVVVETL